MLAKLVQSLALNIVEKVGMVANFAQLHQYVLILLFVAASNLYATGSNKKLLVELNL